MLKKVMVNGLSLAYERHGHGIPLVLLHGYPLDHRIWGEVVPLLQEDLDLILPDVRGFGQSDAPETPYTLDDLAEDLAALLTHLGLERVAVGGHSMGGYIALAFARRHPARVSALALIASQAAADTPERRAGRYQTAEQIRHQGVEPVATTMSERLVAHPDWRPRLQDLIRQQRPAGLIGALRAMAERPDALHQLAQCPCPVLLIHGQADTLIPIERAREIKARLPQAHLVEIPAVAHMPMLEAPAITAEALKWLASGR
jgi:pimeloyl-ACP methyl ester carboxylesterase